MLREVAGSNGVARLVQVVARFASIVVVAAMAIQPEANSIVVVAAVAIQPGQTCSALHAAIVSEDRTDQRLYLKHVD